MQRLFFSFGLPLKSGKIWKDIGLFCCLNGLVLGLFLAIFNFQPLLSEPEGIPIPITGSFDMPIELTSNAEVAAYCTEGSGIATDPYIIANRSIVHGNTIVRLCNIDVYLVLYNINATGSESPIYINMFGISIWNCSHITVRSVMVNLKTCGVHIVESNNIHVEDCKIVDGIGIELDEGCADITLTNLQLFNCSLLLEASVPNLTISGINTINGHPLLYFYNQADFILTHATIAGQMIYSNCHNFTIIENQFDGFHCGLLFINCTNFSLVSNTFNQTYSNMVECFMANIVNNSFFQSFGLSSLTSSDVLIEGNFFNNTWSMVFFQKTSHFAVVNNTCFNSYRYMNIYDSTDGVIWKNTFYNYTGEYFIQVSQSTNVRFHQYQVGNYWEFYSDFYPEAQPLGYYWNTSIYLGRLYDEYPLVNPYTYPDTIPPIWSLLPPNITLWEDEEIRLPFAAVDENSTVTYSLAGSSLFSLTEENYLINNSVVPAGNYSLSLTAMDTSGNRNSITLIITILPQEQDTTDDTDEDDDSSVEEEEEMVFFGIPGFPWRVFAAISGITVWILLKRNPKPIK